MLRDHDGGGGGHELVGVGWVRHARRHLSLGEHGHRHEVDVGLALGHHAAAVGRGPVVGCSPGAGSGR